MALKKKVNRSKKEDDCTLMFLQVVALLQELKGRSTHKNSNNDSKDTPSQNKFSKVGKNNSSTLMMNSPWPMSGTSNTIRNMIWDELFGVDCHAILLTEFGKDCQHKVQGMMHMTETDV
ncbi:hypothetical protein ACA910_019936 [Epithemia clementina (nom. ined.)]